MRLPRRLSAGLILLALALLVAMALAACGGASGDTGVASANSGTGQPSASPSSTTSAAEQVRKYAQCLRDHGIDVSDPDTGAGGGGLKVESRDPAKMDAAQKACQKYAPGSGGANSRPDPQALARARRFSQCMRDHGVPDFPDPDPNGGGIRVSGTRGSDLTPDNPTFKKAEQACQSLIGKGPTTRTDSGSGKSSQADTR